MTKILYIHGWGSSGDGETAVLLKTLIPGLIAPTLDYYHPIETLSRLLSIVDDRAPTDDVYIIASSLGGYFAENIANRRVVNVVFYNPSLRPYEVSRIDPVVMPLLRTLSLPARPTTASTRSVVLCSDDDVVAPEYAAKYFADYDVIWSTGGHRMTPVNATLVRSLLNTKQNQV